MDKIIKEKIRHAITETLLNNPQGLSPKELYDTLTNFYDKGALQEVLSFMWNEDKSLIGPDRKLRIKNKVE